MKTNPSRNTYYWRAVKRLAERYDVSIAKARKMDWEKEANAEQRRRSKAHLKARVRQVSPTRKPLHKLGTPASSDTRTRQYRKPPARIGSKAIRGTGIPTRRVTPKLKIREYERVRAPIDEEEYDEEVEFEEDWERDWEAEYSELDDLDNLDDFLEEFEYADDDKYKEPS